MTKNSWYNQFDVLNQLGEGGNAIVYRIKSKENGEEFAIKKLNNKSQEKKGRFIDEINIIEQNYESVDGIIPIIQSSSEEFWYTMPIAEPILKHIEIASETIKDIIRGVIQLAETLSKLHSKGISHRDIKPSNIYYYMGRYCFGDFGLVDFPDNQNDFTRSDKGLGAIFTIAPEMKRDPKNADGKKADVFSLAKTTWMLLSGDEKGFDGVYNFLDESYSLRFMDRYKNVHLVELEEVLTYATNNNPELRPNIDSFKQELKRWLDVVSDPEKSQASDWEFLNKYLFGENPPESTTWRSTDKIVKVLNIIGTLPAYNHMLFSGQGGLDFSKAELANEDNCIYIYDSSGYCSIIKPKGLYYESFKEDYIWNYFLLELDELFPISLHQSTLEYEMLVEDTPAHYVPATYACYGVYDYDSGVPFPSGYKIVYRYLHGKILIVLKKGPYNGISATYDGRHGMCSNDKFREYISSLIKKTNQLKDSGLEWKKLLNSKELATNPFVKEQKIDTIKEDYKNPNKYIEENYNKWCFKELFEKKLEKENISFYITFDIDNYSMLSITSQKEIVLCVDGYLKIVHSENLKEAYFVTDRDEAIMLYEQCIAFMNEKCKEFGYDAPKYKNYFNISLIRKGKPTHLFTKEEIKQTMCMANDRISNILVIDENGYPQMIQDNFVGKLYPVRHESWNAGNKYVGKYSKLLTIDDDYLSSLEGWLDYLEYGIPIYKDYCERTMSCQELIEKINKFY